MAFTNIETRLGADLKRFVDDPDQSALLTVDLRSDRVVAQEQNTSAVVVIVQYMCRHERDFPSICGRPRSLPGCFAASVQMASSDPPVAVQFSCGFLRRQNPRFFEEHAKTSV